MRNTVRGRLAQLATAAIGATLLLLPTGAASAQPAAHPTARPAAQPAPGPAVCPQLNRSPAEPNSCGPQTGTCNLSVGDPAQHINSRLVYVNGGLTCTAFFTTATLILELYNVASPIPVAIETFSFIAGRTVNGSVGYECHSGDWYGKVRARVQWTIGDVDNEGPLVGSPEPIRCLV